MDIDTINYENEIWKDIEGYIGYYQISNYGRVKSLSRPIYFTESGLFHRMKKETIKTPKPTKDGYLSVTLSVNGNDKNYLIHRLVAEAFINKPNTDDYLEVNHKDMNRKNNHVENLEWTTHQINVKYSAQAGKYCCHEGNKNGRCRPVDVYDQSENKIAHFDYLRECARWMIKNNYCRGKNIDSILTSISKSIRNNQPYFNFIFKNGQ